MHYELRDAGLISVTGPDAASFLHAQLTSDVLGIEGERMQYSGYCSPKGRLLSTLALWRTADELLLQLPARSAMAVRTRLARYVLRSRVTLSDAAERFRLHGIAGAHALAAVETLVGRAPASDGAIASRDGYVLARISPRRSILLSPVGSTPAFEDTGDAQEWARMDIEDGIPWITPETEDRFVPQMVNLDLIGGVSFSKGCYPGQEIVARMRYLGRLKQRMYRVRLTPPSSPRAGDPLFSSRFGADQACGTLVNVVSDGHGAHEALAVVQMESAREGTVHLQHLEGPAVEFLSLPYAVPE